MLKMPIMSPNQFTKMAIRCCSLTIASWERSKRLGSDGALSDDGLGIGAIRMGAAVWCELHSNYYHSKAWHGREIISYSAEDVPTA